MNRNIYKYLKRNKIDNILLLLLMFIWAGSMVVASLILTYVLNAIIEKDFYLFIKLMGFDILCWIIACYSQAMKDTVKEKLIQKQLNEIRLEILEPITEGEYSVFTKNTKSQYISWLINDMQILRDNGFAAFYGAVECIVTVGLNAFAIIYLHWSLLIVSIIMTIFVYYSPKLLQRDIENKTKQVSEESEKILDKTTDYINGFEIFYHNNRTDYFKTTLLKNFENLLVSKVKLVKLNSVAYSISMFSGVLAQLIIFIVTGYLIFKGEITVGVIFAIANLTSCLFNYTRGVAQNVVTFNATFKLINKYPSFEKQKNKLDKIEFKNKIKISNLSVNFGSKEIKYPDLEIKKGMKVAILGDSGSGKTTLLKILSGELSSYKGNLYIDDMDIKTINHNNLKNILGYITQTPYIFNDSIENNVLLGMNFLENDVNEALDLACIKEFGNNLDRNSKDTLSGGQKSRIAIARELLRKKEILILDEISANIDKNTAIQIEKNILEQPNLTVIMVTHHLYDENKKYFDKIIELI